MKKKSMSNRKVFEIESLGKKKRRSIHDPYKWVIRGLKLDIFAGERLGLIGQSGSGKTTLIRMLADLEMPDEGNIEYNGVLLEKYKPSEYRRSVGFVQQNPTLLDNTIEDNLDFGPKLFKKPLKREEMISILERVGLNGNLLSARAGSLSAGQVQRVAIARALAVKPNIILMDEPTSALDPTSARKIVRLVENLAEQMELTAVIVLHDLALAEGETDRLAFLHSGKIDSIAKTSEFFENPPSETARLFIEGRLEERGN